jgi:hypothetical protein
MNHLRVVFYFFPNFHFRKAKPYVKSTELDHLKKGVSYEEAFRNLVCRWVH